MTNYFSNLFWRKAYTLYLPKGQKEQAERYVQKHSSRAPNPAERPFRTQLEFWAMCVAVAAARDVDPLSGPPSRWGTKFIDTRSVNIGEDLGGFLCVLAAEKYGIDAADALNPRTILELGNRLAGAGCPVLLQHLTDVSLSLAPLSKVLNLVDRLAVAADGQPTGAETDHGFPPPLPGAVTGVKDNHASPRP